MKIAEDMREYTAKRGINEQPDLQKGMEEKSCGSRKRAASLANA